MVVGDVKGALGELMDSALITGLVTVNAVLESTTAIVVFIASMLYLFYKIVSKRNEARKTKLELREKELEILEQEYETKKKRLELEQYEKLVTDFERPDFSPRLVAKLEKMREELTKKENDEKET